MRGTKMKKLRRKRRDARFAAGSFACALSGAQLQLSVLSSYVCLFICSLILFACSLCRLVVPLPTSLLPRSMLIQAYLHHQTVWRYPAFEDLKLREIDAFNSQSETSERRSEWPSTQRVDFISLEPTVQCWQQHYPVKPCTAQ